MKTIGFQLGYFCVKKGELIVLWDHGVRSWSIFWSFFLKKGGPISPWDQRGSDGPVCLSLRRWNLTWSDCLIWGWYIEVVGSSTLSTAMNHESSIWRRLQPGCAVVAHQAKAKKNVPKLSKSHPKNRRMNRPKNHRNNHPNDRIDPLYSQESWVFNMVEAAIRLHCCRTLGMHKNILLGFMLASQL